MQASKCWSAKEVTAATQEPWVALWRHLRQLENQAGLISIKGGNITLPWPSFPRETIKKEVKRLCELGVLERQPASEWASPSFIIPKKDKTVRFLSDFREVNKRLVRKPFPIPKISTVLQEIEGFSYATALDLNMGYYTIRLDPDASKICTVIFPWGKYSYKRLPMGIAGSPDIFQEKMLELMESLEFVRAYLDDLLCISKLSLEDHLDKLEVVLGNFATQD